VTILHAQIQLNFNFNFYSVTNQNLFKPKPHHKILMASSLFDVKAHSRGVHPPEPMKHSPLFWEKPVGRDFPNTFFRQNCPLYPPKFLMTFFSHWPLFSNFSLPGCTFPITPSYISPLPVQFPPLFFNFPLYFGCSYTHSSSTSKKIWHFLSLKLTKTFVSP